MTDVLAEIDKGIEGLQQARALLSSSSPATPTAGKRGRPKGSVNKETSRAFPACKQSGVGGRPPHGGVDLKLVQP